MIKNAVKQIYKDVKGHRPEVLKAERLWLQGKTLREVAEEINVHHTTIHQWRDMYDWGSDLHEVDKRTREHMISAEVKRRKELSEQALIVLDDFTCQVTEHLERSRHDDTLLSPNDLQKLVNTFCTVLNHQRLLLGEVVEREPIGPDLRTILLEQV